MTNLFPEMPARLLRSRAEWPGELTRAPMEEVGSGSLAKMLRIALSDPDDELWPYAILVGGETIAGNRIRDLAQEIDTDPDAGPPRRQ